MFQISVLDYRIKLDTVIIDGIATTGLVMFESEDVIISGPISCQTLVDMFMRIDTESDETVCGLAAKKLNRLGYLLNDRNFLLEAFLRDD